MPRPFHTTQVIVIGTSLHNYRLAQTCHSEMPKPVLNQADTEGVISRRCFARYSDWTIIGPAGCFDREAGAAHSHGAALQPSPVWRPGGAAVWSEPGGR